MPDAIDTEMIGDITADLVRKLVQESGRDPNSVDVDAIKKKVLAKLAKGMPTGEKPGDDGK